MFATVIAVIFALVLVVGVPALSYSTARNPKVRELSRIDLYLSAVISQWMLAIIGIGVIYGVARDVLTRGFAMMPPVELVRWVLIVSATAIVSLGIVLWCERRGWMPGEPDLVHQLMPETPQEKAWAIAIIAPTAAFCEELLFRGFLLGQLDKWLHSITWAWVVSSIAFGLAHFYQRWSGMIRAGLLGALLAYPVVKTGSLYPSILAHWIIDCIAMLWLSRWLVTKPAPASENLNPPS